MASSNQPYPYSGNGTKPSPPSPSSSSPGLTQSTSNSSGSPPQPSTPPRRQNKRQIDQGRIPLHRRGTSRTYENLEDLLREAGYKETRIYTPESDRIEPHARDEEGDKPAGKVQGVRAAVVGFLTALVTGAGNDTAASPSGQQSDEQQRPRFSRTQSPSSPLTDRQQVSPYLRENARSMESIEPPFMTSSSESLGGSSSKTRRQQHYQTCLVSHIITNISIVIKITVILLLEVESIIKLLGPPSLPPPRIQHLEIKAIAAQKVDQLYLENGLTVSLSKNSNNKKNDSKDPHNSNNNGGGRGGRGLGKRVHYHAQRGGGMMGSRRRNWRRKKGEEESLRVPSLAKTRVEGDGWQKSGGKGRRQGSAYSDNNDDPFSSNNKNDDRHHRHRHPQQQQQQHPSFRYDDDGESCDEFYEDEEEDEEDEEDEEGELDLAKMLVNPKRQQSIRSLRKHLHHSRQQQLLTPPSSPFIDPSKNGLTAFNATHPDTITNPSLSRLPPTTITGHQRRFASGKQTSTTYQSNNDDTAGQWERQWRSGELTSSRRGSEDDDLYESLTWLNDDKVDNSMKKKDSAKPSGNWVIL
ncbi:hypothetical protein AGABI1DRAFT_108776 [Agaricus bisporus var. burnettii JB137-S8]|uniref:Uncharacterized protein n=1 Tax=Agaricus bisporus var. burnettii (strain JB137-S8 / ATCC MYA-4627 / FGSC 10392) TaxID=597362 RepID=K5WMA1_AGABU|nr:uncharacterized protein AGABI1DRAFT_108776 [Agaricus bisporus var. burnettii JB137-S8]EKM76451.1 hypothetical protein AGABI1DRAFT_108776 [Agaricus bisporus var. burnettii JB137-S8]